MIRQRPSHSITFFFFLLLFTIHISESTSKKSQIPPSLLRIDPTNILPIMTKYGGLILPPTVERDLQNLEKICKCEECYLDVINRELEIRNVTVSLMPRRDGDQPALRVGRLFFSWDSYLKPCVEMELDDVDVLVEFWNLMLTRTNWHELNDAGFPPKTTTTSPNQPPSTFLRVGSITLSGQITLFVQSRPLNSQPLCLPVALNLRTLDELTERVRYAASHSEGGRRGCTTAVISDIVGKYVNDKVRELLKSAAVDVARSQLGKTKEESHVFKEGKRLWGQARETAIRYAGDVKDKTEKDLEKVVKAELKKRWGLDEEKMKSLVGIVENVATEALGKVEGVTIEIGGKKEKTSKKNGSEEDSGIPYKQWLSSGYKQVVDRILNADGKADAQGSESEKSGALPSAKSKGVYLKVDLKGKSQRQLQPDEIFFPPW